MEIDDVRAFVWIAAARSISRVARERALPKATLSHRLRRLERKVGAPLLSRGASGLALTEAGRSFLEHALHLEASYDRAMDAVAGPQALRGGRLAVGATDELSTNLLAPLALQFAKSRQGISLDLQVMPLARLLDRESDIDCMLCSGLPATENGAHLIARGFARYAARLYAAPSYLERFGTPARISDLVSHHLLAGGVGGTHTGWALTNGKATAVVEPRGPIRSEDNWVAKVCAIQGHGIGLFPDFFAQEHVAAGDLVQVLPEWSTASTVVTVLYHEHRFANPLIRAFVDFLVREFEGFYRFPYRDGDVIT